MALKTDARRRCQRRFLFLAQTLQTVACNAAHSVEIRCCRWLLTTQNRVGEDELPLTHEFLAEMLGVQRTAVTEVTRTLQEKGLIRQTRGMTTVLDRASLEQAACECIKRQFALSSGVRA